MHTKRNIKLLAGIFATLLFVSCSGAETPPIAGNITGLPDTIEAGAKIGLSIEASGQDLHFEWTATDGSFSDPTKASVIYTAPNSSVEVVVTVNVTSGKLTVTKSVKFTVVTPTPEPTETPPPATSTPEPTFTPISSATQIPTNTPPLPPLIETFPQVDGGEEFIYTSHGGLISNEFVPNKNCVHSGFSGVRLTYDMKGEGFGGWGLIWNNASATHFDASGFTTFTFWVKGTSGGETFQLGLRDTSEKEVKVESKSLVLVTTDWLMVTVPLSKFNGVNISSIRNVNFGFPKNHGSGSICIDDIAFAP